MAIIKKKPLTIKIRMIIMRMRMSLKAVQFKTAVVRIMIKEIKETLHLTKLQGLEEYPNLL
jgi:hypothetical protein